MKKVMSMLLMCIMGLVGTYAWAGSAREDSVARLQSSVDVLHAIMATPDKGIPEDKASTPKSADAFIKAVSDAGQQASIAEAIADKK